MKAKDRRRWLEHMATQFHKRHPDWRRLSNPSDLPYLAIFLERQLLPQCRVFVGFYNWRGTKTDVTIGWLSQDWHPRTRELVVRYLEHEGSLAQIHKLGGTPDFDHSDFERSLGTLIPISFYESKGYETDETTYLSVTDSAVQDIESAGFEYLSLMLQHRHRTSLPKTL